MNSRGKIWRVVFVLLASGLVFSVFHHFYRLGPAYQGRGINSWFHEQNYLEGPAIEAFRHMGPAAVPFLLTQLHAQDSHWDQFYLNTWIRFPNWLKRWVPAPHLPNWRRSHAVAMLSYLGRDARAAVQSLIADCNEAYCRHHSLPTNTPLDWVTIITAAEYPATHTTTASHASGAILPNAPRPTTEDIIWQNELRTLTEIGGDNQDLIPLLLGTLRDPDLRFRGDLLDWMEKSKELETAARKAYASELAALTNADPEMRAAAAYFLGAPAQDRAKVIPPLIKALNDETTFVRVAVVTSLGNARVELNTVIPALERAREDRVSYVRIAATNALQKLETNRVLTIDKR